MKRTFTFPVAATVVMLALGLTNCKKESVPGNSNVSNATEANGLTISSFYAKEDRIDMIVRDLAQSSYSLSFDKPIPSAGITKTAYGAESFVVFADPQDLICGDPIIKKFQRYIPVWSLPKLIIPTCPRMIWDPFKSQKIREILEVADPAQFKGLQDIKLSNGGVLMAGQQFTKQYAAMQADKVDDILKGLDPTKYILFMDPAQSYGLSKRNAYGYADLTDIYFRKYKKELKDLVKPILVGCFDPEIMKIIKEGFERVSPETFRGLGVNPVEQAADIATLGF